MDLVVKEVYLSEKAKRVLKELRQSGVNITDLINKMLEGYSSTLKTEKVA